MKRLERPDYLNWLISHKDEQIIKVVTGVRRCGKSTIFEIYRDYLLAHGVLPEQIIALNFEDLDYEDVDYWNELCEIMDYSRENVYSTIHLCWGALAGLYYHFGVRKVHLPEKMFGVFEHRVVRPSNPLVRGFDEVFYAPHSRWAGLNRADIDAAPELRMLAESDVAGPMLLSTESGRQIFVIGHPEYDKYTLDAEYRRDVKAGKEIHVPVNYYPDDDPNKDPIFRWRAHAHLLYTNWLNYYVYQNTPYDLDDLEAVVDPPRT